MDDYLYKQLICLNGHQITDRAYQDEEVNEFCQKCGAKVIDSCPSCNSQIDGFYYVSGVLSTEKKAVPKYCRNCGKPYPWTRSSLEALEELVSLSQLDIQEKNELYSSASDLISDTPKTKLAAYKWKKIGKPILDVAHDILVEIASDAAIKLIYGK